MTTNQFTFIYPNSLYYAENDYFNACAANDFHIVMQGIKENIGMPIDKGDNKESGIVVACKLGHIDIVKAFIEEMGYNNSEDLQYALMFAIMSDKTEIVSYLLEKSKPEWELFKEHTTLLALARNKPTCLNILMEHNISFLTKDNDASLLITSFADKLPNEFNIFLQQSNLLQINNLLESLIKNEKKAKNGNKFGIDINKDHNNNYFVFNSYLKTLPEESLNILNTTCKKYTIFNRPGLPYLKTNALFFKEIIDKSLLYYKLDNMDVVKPKQEKKRKI